MPRAWGYIFVLVAMVAAVGALLYPLPETYEQLAPAALEVKPAAKPDRRAPRKADPSARPRRVVPPPKTARPALPPKLPSRDTTKARIMVPPRPAGK